MDARDLLLEEHSAMHSAAVGGNKASAARLLGVDRTTLYRKLQRQEQTATPPVVVAPPAVPRSRR